MPYAPSSSRAREFFAGMRDELPILLGVVPFGVIFGVLAVQAGLPQAQAQAMSFIIFAGSAQFITAQLLAQSTPALVIVFTVFVVNLRHALYSASVAPHIKYLNRGWKALLAYLLTDEAYAVAITRYTTTHVMDTSREDVRHWYYLGCGLTLWVTWQISTAAGVFIGAQVGEGIRSILDFTLPLTFIAIVVPGLKDKASLAAAVCAGVVAVLAFNLDYRLGLIVAAIVGIAVGVALENFQLRQSRDHKPGFL
jgi:4-azaleucine resistance transporter AzlC